MSTKHLYNSWFFHNKNRIQMFLRHIYQVQQNKIYLTNEITSYIDINHGDYAKACLAAIT